uniref:malonyl-coenzyme A:anthocyanin 3-O-glucoside-6''-O-malonyltransferase-like n=1 Tax=Erigeron canadensis TaxID=72917 RepID=UPI001CB8E131|nr:malonyl-coenzyme A:anthocyanin 3-O-glucoside-6''-O-malonyltransferase-like [Erigeron canadensis]
MHASSDQMASHQPILTVLHQSQVSPPPATIGNASLPLTSFDILFLLRPPIHHVFFYELSPITKHDFIETIVPKLKHSLSITLQHFFPFAGNLIVYRASTTSATEPQIRYVEGEDSVEVTCAECNLDFKDLTGNHPRNCDKFHHLIPPLGDYSKLLVSDDYIIKIPVFSLQITLFPDHGFSLGMTSHHCLGDASTHFCFLEAWTTIARCGDTDNKLFLRLPIYERVVHNYPELDERFSKGAKVETLFNGGYQPPDLSSSAKNKVRGTFVLPRTIIDQMKKKVWTQEPRIPYVSSVTVTCAYLWRCIAKSREDELELFAILIDCKTRLADKPIPEAYFGNCILGSFTLAKTTLLTGDDGFINAARLLGENLHNMLTDKDGIVAHRIRMMEDNSSAGRMMPTTIIGVSGSPKLKFYDLDFGWGKPKKQEIVSLDYDGSISIDTCKDSDHDLEIGVCLTTTEMQTFVRTFNQGLQHYRSLVRT